MHMWLFVRYVKYLVLLVVFWIVLWLQSYFRIWRVDGATDYMSPVIQPDSFLHYDPTVREIHQIRPKDIILYKQMDGGALKTYIGRVIAKEGQSVSIRGGEVFVNNQPFPEEYIGMDERDPDERFEEITIPKDHLFVLVDRRSRKEDSRKFGPIHISCVMGRKK